MALFKRRGFENKSISEKEYEKIIDPLKMTSPKY